MGGWDGWADGRMEKVEEVGRKGVADLLGGQDN
jgi:hypothetical protein